MTMEDVSKDLYKDYLCRVFLVNFVDSLFKSVCSYPFVRPLLIEDTRVCVYNYFMCVSRHSFPSPIDVGPPNSLSFRA